MCAIFGLIDYNKVLTPKHRTKLLQVLSTECETRGTDATGFAYISKDALHIYKRPRPARKMKLFLPPDANVVMGHTRMATQGDQRINRNNHPFIGNANVKFALAHNGVIYNDNSIQQQLGRSSNIQTDSYVAVQLIEEKKTLNFDTLMFMAEQLRGTFMFTILDETGVMYFVRGNNPITMYRFNGFYVYASTVEILDKALHKLGLDAYTHEQISIPCGCVMTLYPDGSIESERFELEDERWGWLGSFDMWRGNQNESTKNSNRSVLMEYASAFGFSEGDVQALLDYGYDEDEIEELLYSPDEFERVISAIYGDEDEIYCNSMYP